MSERRSAVAWTGDAIEIIDQTLLPTQERILRLTTPAEVIDAIRRLAVRGAPAEVIDAIRRLAVRGAPAIGVCGAFGVVLAAARPERLEEDAAAIAAAR